MVYTIDNLINLPITPEESLKVRQAFEQASDYGSSSDIMMATLALVQQRENIENYTDTGNIAKALDRIKELKDTIELKKLARQGREVYDKKIAESRNAIITKRGPPIGSSQITP